MAITEQQRKTLEDEIYKQELTEASKQALDSACDKAFELAAHYTARSVECYETQEAITALHMSLYWFERSLAAGQKFNQRKHPIH